MISIILDDGADEPFDCLNVTCPNDYFKCPLSGKCISKEKVCDHFEDCPDLDRINGITADETSGACKSSSALNHTTSASPIHITCESADLFRCKTTEFCINRTYVCE
jgi:Low-density lipoprotein receptor domain class A